MPDFIRSLAREGELNSQGEFTLDPQLAMRKLRQRLLQPEDCLLYLLQSAVASGASWVKVESGPGEIVFRHDGFFPAPEQAPELLSWVFESASNPQQVARHRLGMALASCLTPPGRGLRLEYPDGRAFEYQAGKTVSLQLASAPEGRQFRMPIKQSWWHRLVGTGRCATLTRLRQRGRFAPIALTVDGQPISAVEFGKEAYSGSWAIWSSSTTQMGGGEDDPYYYNDHHAIEVRIACRTEADERLGIPPVSKASALFAGEGGKACSAALAWRMKRRPGRVEVVQYGVSLALEVDFIPAQLWILVADQRMPTDLTCLKPVLSEPLRQRVNELHEEFTKVFDPLRKEYISRAVNREALEAWLVRTGKWAGQVRPATYHGCPNPSSPDPNRVDRLQSN